MLQCRDVDLRRVRVSWLVPSPSLPGTNPLTMTRKDCDFGVCYDGACPSRVTRSSQRTALAATRTCIGGALENGATAAASTANAGPAGTTVGTTGASRGTAFHRYMTCGIAGLGDATSTATTLRSLLLGWSGCIPRPSRSNWSRTPTARATCAKPQSMPTPLTPNGCLCHLPLPGFRGNQTAAWTLKIIDSSSWRFENDGAFYTLARQARHEPNGNSNTPLSPHPNSTQLNQPQAPSFTTTQNSPKPLTLPPSPIPTPSTSS